MATSSKVVFHLETLFANALESLNFRIERLELELKTLGTDEALNAQVAEWRGIQEGRIKELAKNIKTTTDLELSRFKLDEVPKRDTYERSRVKNELERLMVTRSKMEAKASSLMADEDGSISLTKTQLAEFFDL